MLGLCASLRKFMHYFCVGKYIWIKRHFKASLPLLVEAHLHHGVIGLLLPERPPESSQLHGEARRAAGFSEPHLELGPGASPHVLLPLSIRLQRAQIQLH